MPKNKADDGTITIAMLAYTGSAVITSYLADFVFVILNEVFSRTELSFVVIIASLMLWMRLQYAFSFAIKLAGGDRDDQQRWLAMWGHMSTFVALTLLFLFILLFFRLVGVDVALGLVSKVQALFHVVVVIFVLFSVVVSEEKMVLGGGENDDDDDDKNDKTSSTAGINTSSNYTSTRDTASSSLAVSRSHNISSLEVRNHSMLRPRNATLAMQLGSSRANTNTDNNNPTQDELYV